MAMFRARKARSCFMRLLIAHAVTRKGFACKTRRAATRLEKRSRPARGEVLLQEIRRDVEGVIAVRGALELSAADDLDAVLAHKSPDTALFDTKAQPIQLLGHAWSSLAAQAQAVLVADVRQDLGHSLGPMAFMPSTYRAACDATGACASRYGARALKRPSGGTDGCGSGCRNTWQYPETSRLLSREERRRFFLVLTSPPAECGSLCAAARSRAEARHPARAAWIPPKPPRPTCRASKARSPNQTQPDAVSGHW